jgi:translocator protein
MPGGHFVMIKQNSVLNALGYTRLDVLRLAISIAIPLAAGIIGAIFTAESISTWYQIIEKPWFTPPGWIFGPAWTALYILMGVSLFFVWKKKTSSSQTIDERQNNSKVAAYVAYGAQLALNALWSILFFGLRSPQVAFAEIIVLLASISITIALFFKISKLASALMLPYAGWVTFASLLNLQVWLLNS